MLLFNLLLALFLLVVAGLAEAQDGESTGCIACDDGTVDESLSVLGIPCSNWLAEAMHDRWEGCTLQRAIGVHFCGCGEGFEMCFLCGDATGNQSVNRSKPIPDMSIPGNPEDSPRPVLTCGDIMELPDVDSGVTCPLLRDKYAFWCGCPNAQADGPTCPFCEYGGEPNLDLPYPFPVGSWLPADPSCLGAHDLTVVQSSAECDSFRENALRGGGYVIDMNFYCQCPGVEPPEVCQGSYCPEGTAIPDDKLDAWDLLNGYGGMTCGMLSMEWDLNAKARHCKAIERTASDCCTEEYSTPSVTPSSAVPGMVLGRAILAECLLLVLFLLGKESQ